MTRPRSSRPDPRREHAVGAAGEAPLAAAARGIGVRDERVLAAIAAVPRAEFVPDHLRDQAELDRPLRLDNGQVTTQPSLVAVMVEALGLRGDERVLEVGTGLGYQAAVLANLAAEVVTVERFPDFAEAARRNLDAAGYAEVEVVVGDASRGLSEHAPYDAIVVAAAFPKVPDPLADQLTDDGRLVQPLGAGGREEVTLFEATPRGLQRVRTVIDAAFVRLVGEEGFEG